MGQSDDRAHDHASSCPATPRRSHAFGAYDKFADKKAPTSSRAIEIAYRNGAGIVHARAVAANAGDDAYTAAFEEL